MIDEVHSMVTAFKIESWLYRMWIQCFKSNGSNGFTLNVSNGFTTNGFTSDEANGFTTWREVKVQREASNFSLSNSSSHKPARTIYQLSSLSHRIFLPGRASSLSFLTGSSPQLGRDFTLLHKYHHVPKLTCDNCCFTSAVSRIYNRVHRRTFPLCFPLNIKFLVEIWF